MSIFTPNGLKICLHPERVERVLAAVAPRVDLAGAYRDVELWSDLPGAALAVTAVATAWITRSWLLSLAISCLAFLLANLFQQFFYSRLLKMALPQFLGSRFVVLPASLASAFMLFRQGATGAALTQLAIVVASILGVADILLLIFMPLRIAVRSLAGRRVRDLGDVEFAFVRALNQRARDVGVTLDWTIYDQRET